MNFIMSSSRLSLYWAKSKYSNWQKEKWIMLSR